MPDRIVPAPAMGPVPVSGLPELEAHLHDLVDDAALPIEVKLLDQVELQLNDTNTPPLLPTLLPLLTRILKATSQDPTPLLSLTVKLLSPLSFVQAVDIADPPSLLTALRSPLPGANLLALAIVHKAAASPADAAILSTLPDLVEEVVRRWLESPDVGVGERAAKVLGDVLETDCDVVCSNGASSITGNMLVRRTVPGEARIWRLIFQNHSHLSLIQNLCTSNLQPPRSTHAMTTSQGRVLRMLPRLAALDIRVLSQCPFLDLFPLPDATAQQVGRGLLQWAALAMVTKSDVLMHLSLIDFFEAFVSVMCVSDYARERDDVVKSLVRVAVRDDEDLDTALGSLPDRTVEEEAERLRQYITNVLG